MKLWAHHPGGTISEPLFELPDNLTPGKDIFAAFDAADLTDITGRDPKPEQGWTTTDGGKTFAAPPPAPDATTPVSVTSAQAKIQLLRTPGSADGKTLLDDVTAAVQKAGGEVAIWFTDARTWERNNHDVAQIVRQRQGRCGEYAQTLYQLLLALRWPTRLVVDWTDHLWVEALLPVQADGSLRWVPMDPCEAAVDDPMLYSSWGKNHTFLVAIGDGGLADVTATYACDVNETIRRREMSSEELRRALSRACFLCRPPR